MYQGLKITDFAYQFYLSVFCIRRLFLVFALLLFYEKRFWLIIAYNGLQTLYYAYMVHFWPHEAPLDNWLEFFNEICLILLQYSMIFYIGNTVDPLDQWKIGYCSMTVIAVIFFVNFAILVYLTIYKLKLWYKKLSNRFAYNRLMSRMRRSRMFKSSSTLTLSKIQPLATLQDEEGNELDMAVGNENNPFESDRSLLKI